MCNQCTFYSLDIEIQKGNFKVKFVHGKEDKN